MAPVLLFITGVLAGVIAGFVLSSLFRRGSAGDGAGERRLLEERLFKADQGLEQFSRQLEAQAAELKGAQQEALQAREAAAISRTELEAVVRERDGLQRNQTSNQALLEQLRADREMLSTRAAEITEQLRSQESQTQFLEQSRADLLTQFCSLSGQMLDGSREALLKSTKETVSEPFAKEVQQLRRPATSFLKVTGGPWGSGPPWRCTRTGDRSAPAGRASAECRWAILPQLSWFFSSLLGEDLAHSEAEQGMAVL